MRITYLDKTFRIGYPYHTCPVCKHSRGYHYGHASLILCTRRLLEKYFYSSDDNRCSCNYYLDCIDEEG